MSDLKLTIDSGSTEFKAAIYADGLRLLAAAGYELSYSRNGARAELPVNTVQEAFRKVIERAVNAAGVDAKEIDSLGITSQAQTFALTDENGVFLTPFISWLDMRAVATYKTIPADDFAEHSSLAVILPNMQIAILKHILDENPGFARQKLRIVPLPAYLIMLLTGKSVSDNNLAAMSGLFSLKENAYRQVFLDLLGISGKNLPEIVEVGSIAGKVKNDNPFGIPAGKAVFSCGNDQTAGAYGAGLRPGDVLITLGTAQAVYCCRRNMPEPGSGQFRGHYPGGLYYAMFAGTGGGLISQAIAKSPAFRDFETFAGLAADADAGTDAGFYVVNDEPRWSNDNAGLPEKALDLLKFLAGEVQDSLGKLKPRGNIYVSGGGVKNKIWLKLIESGINKKLIIKDTSPCYGAAKMMQAK
ncbi:MAG: FGGY family carbohydrate kinase [Victivallaceae bacterium]|nr:FGGY family carbohydrate kinase [Victivallaceae bacterium]